MALVENDPAYVTAGEIARNFGRWQDEAARRPIVVTHHGRPRVVLVAADAYNLRESGQADDPFETKLSAVLNHSTEGFFALDASMIIVAANQVFQDFFALTASQMIGRSYADVFPTAARSVPGEHFRRVLRTGEPTRFELQSTMRENTILDVRAFPYGDGVGVLYVNRSQERLAMHQLSGAAALEKALLIADHAAVLELNVRGAIVAVSKTFEQMTGFGSAELMRYRLADLLVPRGRGAVLAALETVFAGKGPVSASAVVLGKNGVETPVVLGLAAINADAHQPGVKVVALRA